MEEELLVLKQSAGADPQGSQVKDTNGLVTPLEITP